MIQIEAWKTLVKLENITGEILKKIGLTNSIPIIEETEELKCQNAIILKELERVHESRESGNAIYRSIIRENVGCLRDLKTNLQEKRDSLLNERKISSNLEREIINIRLELIMAKSELKDSSVFRNFKSPKFKGANIPVTAPQIPIILNKLSIMLLFIFKGESDKKLEFIAFR